MVANLDPEEAFRRDPADAEAFATLERKFRDRAERRLLARLYEDHATAQRDAQRAVSLLWCAARCWRDAGDVDNERRVLGKTLILDSLHDRTVHRLAELAEQQGRWSELLRCLLSELDLLPPDASGARQRAILHQRIGRIWYEKCHRLDKAIDHYRAALASNPTHDAALADARALLSSIGQWSDVAELYRFEIARLTQARRKVDLLVELGELLEQRLGKLQEAGAAYAEAAKLRPGDDAIAEHMASLYASPEWPEPAGLQRSAELFVRLAQRRESRNDLESAITYLRRALGADPSNVNAAKRLARAYEDGQRWADLDRLYQQQRAIAEDPLALDLLRKRAELLYDHLGRPDETVAVFEQLTEHDLPNSRSWGCLAQLYRDRAQHRKLVALLARQADATRDQEQRAHLLMEASLLLRDHLGEGREAAQIWRQILASSPTHRGAFEALEQHLAQRGDWHGLVGLLRTTIEASVAANVPPLAICEHLEKLAQISERQLGDLAGAREAWEHLARLHPDRSRSTAPLRNLELRATRTEQMLHELAEKLTRARTPGARLQALRGVGQALYELGIQHERAIEVLREVLQDQPQDEDALAMLAELCRRATDPERLTWVLRRRLDGILSRPERIQALQELAEISAELDQPRDCIWAYEQLLELAPGDDVAFVTLRKLLLQAEDLEHVCRVLQRRADSALHAHQRADALRDLAELMEHKLDAPTRAIEAWETVRQLFPQDERALTELTRLYGTTNRSDRLLETLKQALKVQHRPAERARLLRQAAEAAGKLNRTEDTTRYYQELVQLQPADIAAWRSLAGLYERQGRHLLLVQALERLGTLCEAPEEQLRLAFERIDVLEHHLTDPERAIDIYHQILGQIEPDNLEALHRLKLLQIGRGRYEDAIRIAEREYFLQLGRDAGGHHVRDLALEIAELWCEQLHDHDRATLAYERMLELDSQSRTARQMLHQLYARAGAFLPLVELAPLLLDDLDSAPQRHALMVEMAKVWEQQLGDPLQAFDWYKEAYKISGDGGAAHEELIRLASSFELWHELVAHYEQVAAATAAPNERRALLQRMARHSREQLDAPHRALGYLTQALAEQDLSQSDALVSEIEVVAEEGALHEPLLQVYEQIYQRTSSLAQKAAYLRRSAEVTERKLGDSNRALVVMTRLLRLTSTSHEDAEQQMILGEIERLSEVSEDFRPLTFTYWHRLQRCGDNSGRLGLLRQLSRLYEHKLADPARAFGALLHALMLDIDGSVLQQDLWRLAAALDAAARAPERSLFDEALLLDVAAKTQVEAPQQRDGTAQTTSTEPASAPAIPPIPAPPLAPTGSRDHPVVELSALDLLELESEKPAVAAQLGLRPPPPCSKPSAWHSIEAVLRALAGTDRRATAKALMQLGAMWEEGAGQAEQAFKRLAEAASLVPEDGAPLDQLDRIAVREGWLDRLIPVYEDLIEQAADGETLVRLHRRTAQLLQQHGRLGPAEKHLAAALSARPEDKESVETLTRLYQQTGRFKQLAALLERQLDLQPRPDNDGHTADVILLADVYEQQLELPERAADVLTSLAQRRPDDVELIRRIAALYERARNWTRTVEWLQQLSDVSTDLSERRRIQVRRAEIFERELELPDRAIAAYQQAVDAPDGSKEVVSALVGLRQLYGRHQRYDELIRVLITHADLDGVPAAQRRELLLEAASRLESLDRMEAASQVLRQARNSGPIEEAIERRLAGVLQRCGKPDEAARLLQDQIARLDQTTGPANETAEALVSLARLQRAERPQATGAARNSLARALALCPDHRHALQELTQLSADEGAWEDFALASLRLAEQLERTDAAQQLLQAAQRLAEHHHRAALELLEQAHEKAPENTEVIDALLAAGPPVERTAPLLHIRLELARSPDERAHLLVMWGRLQERIDPESEEPTASYREALALAPGLLEALDALSALQLRRGQPAEARALLEQAVIASQERSNAETLGGLRHRLALLYEQLGEEELAYRQLLEARRLRPKDLTVQLALGQNRFRSGRWREALRYLAKVDEHPDAHTQREAVADALFNTGICERRLRRPARATPLFEAALTLDPEHCGALREVAESARATGRFQRAADLQYQLGRSSASLRERVTMLKSAAELYTSRLRRRDDALRCSESLAQQLVLAEDGDEIDLSEQGELLAEVLDELIAAKSHALAGEVARALSQRCKLPDPGRVEHLLRAGDQYEAAELWEQADEVRNEALELSPANELALVGLARSLRAHAMPQRVCDLLEEHLSDSKEGRSAKGRDKGVSAQLYALLGWAYRELDRETEAIEALERSLRLQESVDARLLLASLYRDIPQYRLASLTNYGVLARDVTQVQALRALAAAAAQGAPYRSYAIYRTLELMGEIDAEGRRFLDGFSPADLGVDQPYAETLDDADRERLSGPGCSAMDEILTMLFESSPDLLDRSLADYGIDPQCRVSPLEETNLAKVYGQVARALQVKKTALYLRPETPAPGEPPLLLAATTPPALIASHTLLSYSVPRLRFLLARALELSRAPLILAAGLEPREFASLLGDLLRAYHPRHVRRKGTSLDAKIRASELRRKLPYKVARRTAELFREQPNLSFDSAKWRRATVIAANRVGLVFCGDVQVAWKQLGRDDPELRNLPPYPDALARLPAARDLLTFAASEEYYAYRVKLGLAGPGQTS